MNNLLVLFERGEIVHFLVAILLLVWIGSKMASERQRSLALGLGSIVMLGYLAFRLCCSVPRTSQDLLDLVARALIVGGLAFGLALFILPIVMAILQATVVSPWSKSCQAVRTVSDRIGARWRSWKTRTPPADIRRQQQDAEQLAVKERDAQQRREDSRAACELLYHLHAHSLGERFSKAVFDDFMTRYMNDKHTPEYVEERGKQLSDLILQHANDISPSRPTKTLAATLDEVKQEIEQVKQSEIDPEWKQSLIAELEKKMYEQLQASLGRKP